MNAPLFVAIVFTVLTLLLGYLGLSRVAKRARATAAAAVRSSAERPEQAARRLPRSRTATLQPEQLRWTVLDDELFARFVRDASR